MAKKKDRAALKKAAKNRSRQKNANILVRKEKSGTKPESKKIAAAGKSKTPGAKAPPPKAQPKPISKVAGPAAKSPAAKPLAPTQKPHQLSPAPTLFDQMVPVAGKPSAAPKAVASKPVKSSAQKPTNGAIKVGVVGCAGRMGQMLLKLLINAPGIVVVGGTERKGSAALGRDLGALAGAEPLGISVTDDPAPLFSQANVVVDFTNPSTTIFHAGLAAKSGCALVVGTTGFDADQLAALHRAAQRAPIVLAANMSLGINLLEQVVEEVARILDADWDIEIIEMHHKHKVDAPSSTALTLGEAAARGRQQQLRRIQRRQREGQTGPRVKGEIGFASLRGGDVVGDHSIIFATEGERVEITHRASSREIFGRGAVKAVLWANKRQPGLYNMRDVLGFSVGGALAED